ncbi:hypothetical protein [Comamonas sp. JC664]|uniref:hypothetical protein n=1 Tax=Comamonas sp. JC664 TaxID=2801917 RepID=UPI001749343F|nr:hypothetical protein [Comamonas sp. JC664]MBL0692565.1 hypothetical protein [Comamonas sp. JC664]GHG92619.1 hypothetical protein GCM10012319_54270 [Comamonas sp. KCTC 72670]
MAALDGGDHRALNQEPSNPMRPLGAPSTESPHGEGDVLKLRQDVARSAAVGRHGGHRREFIAVERGVPPGPPPAHAQPRQEDAPKSTRSFATMSCTNGRSSAREELSNLWGANTIAFHLEQAE